MEIIGGAIGLLVVLMIFGFAVAVNVFWIWMLVLAIQNKGISDGEKIGWVLAIVFFHIIGSVLYLCIGHPKRNMTLLPNVRPI